MSVNAADPASVKDQQRKARTREELQRDDLRALLAAPQFRRYIWRHMHETCGLMRSASNPNGSVQSTNLGMQDVARVLWAEIEAVEPLAIPRMMTEFHTEVQK